MQAKYVKILSHRIPILTDTCDVVLYMDSKISYAHATVSEIFSYEHACITLFEHPWRTFHGAYTQEIADSYNQARYARFKPAIEAQLRQHRPQEFDGVMHLGSTHLINFHNPVALQFQESWWPSNILSKTNCLSFGKMNPISNA
jgi:hypothetical protein